MIGHRTRTALVLATVGLLASAATTGPASAVTPEPVPGQPGVAPTARITGAGSPWVADAIFDWASALRAHGSTIDYSADRSEGWAEFAWGITDFDVTVSPPTGFASGGGGAYQVPDFPYRLLPIAAGGMSFMYNLPVNGHVYRQLRLSQAALAKILTAQITRWDDPAIQATNPGVDLPSHQITVVVHGGAEPATAQLTLWLEQRFPADYDALCARTACGPARVTSIFPHQGIDNFTEQGGSESVTTYTASTPYAIDYDEFRYTEGAGFPVASIQNEAGYFLQPTDTAVSVALTRATITDDPTSDDFGTVNLWGGYTYGDPRTYPLPTIAYLIEPTATHDDFTEARGETLAYFEQHALCEGQQTMGRLGYAPLPMNLVLAGLDQALLVPGISAATRQRILNTKNGVRNGAATPCNNPTFRPGDSPAHNLLVATAPFPADCDAACQAPWTGKAPAAITTRLRPRHPRVGATPHLSIDVTATDATATGKVRVEVDPPRGRTRTIPVGLRRGEAEVALLEAVRGRTRITVTYPGSDTVAKAVKTLTYRVPPTRTIGERP